MFGLLGFPGRSQGLDMGTLFAVHVDTWQLHGVIADVPPVHPQGEKRGRLRLPSSRVLSFYLANPKDMDARL